MSINQLYHTSLQQLRQLRPKERITRVHTFLAHCPQAQRLPKS